MQLARFLNKLFKIGGFVLIDANLNKYAIGSPGKDKWNKNAEKYLNYIDWMKKNIYPPSYNES